MLKNLLKLSYAWVYAILLSLLLVISPYAIQTSYALSSCQETSVDNTKIVASLSGQWLYVYQNGTQIYDSAMTSGRPELPTPTGTYHILGKYHPITFVSPWPASSPYYYSPTTVQYALEFSAKGYYIHDAYWRSQYGPGTNDWHTDPQDGYMTGSHGCINVPLDTAKWLYTNISVGTLMQIND